jgi:L-ascorbate metabolism protein UlaG (beta-lactamase superfamily)
VTVTWLGHLTVLIELDGIRTLTDPVLRRPVSGLVRGGPAPATPSPPAAVLISHGHLDHLDLPSLERFPRETLVVVPRGLRALITKKGFQNVTEVDVGDEVAVGGVAVRATRAEHGGGKAVPGRGRATVGYALNGSASVFFAGDTDLFAEMEGLVPGLDLALLPIWGWGPTMGPGHLDPARAARAVAQFPPAVAVPIPWGRYGLSTTRREPSPCAGPRGARRRGGGAGGGRSGAPAGRVARASAMIFARLGRQRCDDPGNRGLGRQPPAG